jgi:protein-L-isoaspartate(D-aspartate) O-methyltransferase
LKDKKMVDFAKQRKELVERLKRQDFIRTKAVERAMLKVKREDFVEPRYLENAYMDAPLPIPGGGTISAPHN